MSAVSAILIAALKLALTALVLLPLLDDMHDALRSCGLGLFFAVVIVFATGYMQLSGTVCVYSLLRLAI